MSQCDSKINSFFIILIIILLFYEHIFSCCFFWFLDFVMRIGILWLSFCVLYCDGPRPELSVPLRVCSVYRTINFLSPVPPTLKHSLVPGPCTLHGLCFLGFPQSFVIYNLKDGTHSEMLWELRIVHLLFFKIAEINLYVS